MRFMLRYITVFAAILFTTQAQAIQISATGDSWNVNWQHNSRGHSLTATSSWLVSSYSSNKIIIDIALTNTTALSGRLTRADVSAFGFGMSPRTRGSLLTPGNTFNKLFSIWGWQLMYGSGGNGLATGASDSLQLQLTGNFGNSANMVPFPMKFRTNKGYYLGKGYVSNVCTALSPGKNCTPPSVPEPSVLLLLALGLLGIGLMPRLSPAKAAVKVQA